MKRCSVCKEVKELSEFNKDKYGTGGIRAQCKLCQYTIQAHYYKNEKCKTQAKERARSAFKKGLILKPLFCELCGKPGNLEKHHPDYVKPLTVMWIHRACHSRLHRSLKTA